MLLQNGLNQSVKNIVGVGTGNGANALYTTIGNIANVLIILIATVAVLYVIYGAWIWLNEGAQKGQEAVVRAVLGLVVAILAYVIVTLFIGGSTFIGTLLGLR